MQRSRPPVVPSLAALILGSALAGCGSTTLVKNLQETPTGAIAPGESVVVLSEYRQIAGETDGDFIDCIGRSLVKESDALRVISAREFVDGMYPYFEASTAPTSVQAVGRLARDPAARHKMSEMNVRYLVWVDGQTETVDKNGSFSCSIGPGGGGCFGWASWTNHGAYRAKIWDLKKEIEAGSFDVDSTGTSHLIGIVLPIPLLAGVESEACEAVAQRVALAVTGGEAPSVLRQAQRQ